MYIDALLLLSDSQAITAATNSTNVIDLGNPDVKRRVGTGEAVGLGIFVEVAATGGPLTFNVIDSASSDLSSPTVLATVALTAAQMTAGAKFSIGTPPGQGRQRHPDEELRPGRQLRRGQGDGGEHGRGREVAAGGVDHVEGERPAGGGHLDEDPQPHRLARADPPLDVGVAEVDHIGAVGGGGNRLTVRQQE